MSMKNQSQLVGALYNWTDDLPVCKQSGVGYQTNHLYRAGGDRGEVSDYEDRSFHFQCPDDCYLYGIIDGHGGYKVANFAVQKLPAELLLGQLKVLGGVHLFADNELQNILGYILDDYADQEVCSKLQEAFESVAKGFVDDLINDALMEKMNLEAQMPEGMNQGEAFRRFPTLFQRLKELDVEISGGCSAVIALIHKSRLYVANVGDARAVLCRIDEKTGEQGVVQLSTDHTISSHSELRRLDSLGLDIEKLQMSKTATVTRSLGDWALKGGYKHNAELSLAKEEPILSTPSVHGGEKINASMQFLIMMSQGVYTAYQEATGTPQEQVNNNIAFMVREQIMKQATIEGVAQSVVDQICRVHADQYVTSQNQICLKREDMTLLIRLFNAELGKPIAKVKKPTNLKPLVIPHHSQPRIVHPSHVLNDDVNHQSSGPASPQFQPPFSPLPSPLTVTVTTNPNYHGDAANNSAAQLYNDQRKYPAASYYSQQQTPIVAHPGDPKIDNYLPPKDFVGFTEEQQREFFQGQQHGQRSDSKALLIIAPSITPVKDDDTSSGEDDDQLTGSSDAGSVEDRTKLFNRPAEPLETDADGKIKAYVDFTEFLTNLNAGGGEKVVFSQFLDGRHFGS